MAKIKLTRRTFTDAIAEQLDRSNGFEGMLAKALTGKDFKEYMKDQPDKMPMWVDTDKVICVTDLTKDALTGDVVFGIMFTPQAKISEMVWFDGSDFEEFMKTWKGEL